MNALGCLFGFIFGIFFIVLFLLQYLQYKVRKFFGYGPNRNTQQNGGSRAYGSTSQNGTSSANTDSDADKHQKIYAEDEGEYVEYEEIKD